VAWTPPWNLLGLRISGDVGDVTLYKNKNGKTVVFPKDRRQDKQSQRRIDQQARFTTAQANWSALTSTEKLALEDMTKKLSIAMTGQNVYISCQLRNDIGGYSTLEDQSGITLPPFTFVPWP